jgi:hypothetical protein
MPVAVTTGPCRSPSRVRGVRQMLLDMFDRLAHVAVAGRAAEFGGHRRPIQTGTGADTRSAGMSNLIAHGCYRGVSGGGSRLHR